MKLSEHFSLEEFLVSDTAKQIGNDNMPTAEHLEHLKVTAAGFEVARTQLGNRSIVITSGYRNAIVNKAVGGVSKSAHTEGYAGDFHVAGLTPLGAARILQQAMRDGHIAFDQLILETNRNVVHLSFAPRLRREVLTQAGGPGTPFINGLPG